MSQIKISIFIILLVATFLLKCCEQAISQQSDSSFPDTLNRKRFTGLVVTGSVLYASSMFGLYNLWYKGYPQTGFHFIDDNNEWLQMDKIGHTTTSYYLGRISYNALRWSGLSKKKAIWYGGSAGLLFVTTIEIFDGFSAEWGASLGDVAANTLGTAIFISQQLMWGEQRLTMKFSAHHTKYARYNPEQLGRNFIQQTLKDYNGQTFWLSANIKSFCKDECAFPGWLNVALGYGAKGMTGPRNNITKNKGVPVPEFQRTRQYFLSPDIDLTRIPTKSGFLKAIFNIFGFIKIPLPTIEYNKQDNLKFHWIYF